ncbi:MAG: GNAT family N-acetyltransferase [Bacteroidales bacterium]|nr:GNAT family N-acetyltransferase [Bacteroidales bacterium]
MFTIRSATLSDIPELKKLYTDTVMSVNLKDYSIEEVEDWASCGDDRMQWHRLFSEQHFFVAENERSEIVGFASINDSGYIHSLFVHKDFQHQGIATLLYNTLERHAREKGAERVSSEVSITARPFFERQGFIVDEEQRRRANQLYLINYKMSKKLNKLLTEMSNEELWQLFPIILTEHQTHWKDDFLNEAKLLKDKIGPENIEKISHIGSTAIPDLLAKPTIDILLEIKKETDLHNLIHYRPIKIRKRSNSCMIS